MKLQIGIILLVSVINLLAKFEKNDIHTYSLDYFNKSANTRKLKNCKRNIFNKILKFILKT